MATHYPVSKNTHVSTTITTTPIFRDHYDEWTTNRVNKLIQIFGTQWFDGKNILELGSGSGHVGSKLIKLGANLCFTDGRPQHIEKIKSLYPDNECYVIDQDRPYNLEKTFDLVIHWGVLYHLNDWKQDLLSAFKHSSIICLETEVCDSNDDIEIQISESLDHYDHAINLIGTRPSAPSIENFITSNNRKFIRYDESDLNSSNFHIYDWKQGSVCPGEWKAGMRRFWVIS